MPVHQDPTHQKAPGSPNFVLLTPKETANRLKVSLSWLANTRPCVAWNGTVASISAPPPFYVQRK